jgi:hypothetical protein
LPQRKREPLHATHKPLRDALTTIWLSSKLISDATPEPFRTSSSQTLGEALSKRPREKLKSSQELLKYIMLICFLSFPQKGLSAQMDGKMKFVAIWSGVYES